MGSTREKLICHPATPPKAVRSIWIDLEYFIEDAAYGHFNLDYEVICDAAQIVLPPADGRWQIPPTATDELWRSTCFELFTRSRRREEYFEYNFAPDGRWASYRFAGYRDFAANVDLPPHNIEIARGVSGFSVSVSPPFLPIAGPKTLLGISAVIEERDGTKSYWALRHPTGQPDFHHPDCFALMLGAPDPA